MTFAGGELFFLPLNRSECAGENAFPRTEQTHVLKYITFVVDVQDFFFAKTIGHFLAEDKQSHENLKDERKYRFLKRFLVLQQKELEK